MADQQNNVVDQKTELHNDAKHTTNEEGGQPESIDNGASGGEVTENVVAAAAATGDHEEDNVESSSAYRLRANPPSSSDVSSSSPRSIHSQLMRAPDEANTEMTATADQQQRNKLIRNRIFRLITKLF